MSYQRVYIRVPISGEALLYYSKQLAPLKAQAIDISQGGVAIEAPLESLDAEQRDYSIVVIVEDGQKINLKARLVRQDGYVLGFETIHIDEYSRRIIENFVFRYQESDDFLEQIQKHNLFDHLFQDGEGNVLEISFDLNPGMAESKVQ